jgi:hypothetical protein
MKKLALVAIAATLSLAACGGGSKKSVDAFVAERLQGQETQMAPACSLAAINPATAEAMFEKTGSGYSGEDLAEAFVRWCGAHAAG